MRRLSRHDHLEKRQVGRPSVDLEVEDGHPLCKHGTSPPSTNLYRENSLNLRTLDRAADLLGELVRSRIFVPR